MTDGIDALLPGDPPGEAFLLVALVLVVLPVVVILAQIDALATTVAVGVLAVAWVLHRTDLVSGADAGEQADEADPLASLRDRYARGEIGDEEFERRLDRLVETEGLEVADAADDPDLLPERERER